MLGLIYRALDWITDRLVDIMIMIEPKRPRKQELDYHVSLLPPEVLAIVRITWYKDGKAHEVDQVTLMEDGDNGFEAFQSLVGTALRQGANVSIRSGYNPEDLGIYQ